MALELSILIRTTKSRKELTEKLFNKLQYHIVNLNGSVQIRKHHVYPATFIHDFIFQDFEIEVLVNDSEHENVGDKANNLLRSAKGRYIVFIDSDDHISDNYIELVLNACKTDADCIGISGIITTNGKNKKQWHISKEFKTWHEKNGVYYRTPNHISPVKRELALKAGFPSISFGEDAEYSKRLLPLLKTETIIKENIYHYDYWTKK